MVKINSKQNFDRVIVLENPTSTNYAHSRKWLGEIKKLISAESIDILRTSADGKTETAAGLRRIAGKLGPRTLFCIIAGDGTVNFAINFILSDTTLSEKARSTVILPLWGGNGNDMSTMLNGKAEVSKIKKIIQNGTIVSVHPLYCEMSDVKSGPKVRLAGNCIGFGATGMMAKLMNSSEHRGAKLLHMPGGKILQTAVTTWKGSNHSSRFEIFESGVRAKLYERAYFNGPIVAKYYHLPVELLEDRFYVDSWYTKVPIATPVSVLLSTRRRTFRQSEQHFSRKSEFALLQPTWAQFDGEPQKIPSGTHIEIGIYDRPFLALSTVLKN